ncbi:hypothetical protein BKA62DRAFT_770022 [Auriculariales sp. MPI-PUGE-AT-0066]|nr:hypothetical protein BKA62DRAFT_770022 [Auriculariales sp. MPI-PUGE-AT-0066]
MRHVTFSPKVTFDASPHYKRQGSFYDVPIEDPLIEWLNTWRDAAVGDAASNYHGGDVPKNFTNESAIPFGQYRLLLRAPRMGGDLTSQEDYGIRVSEPFGIVEA